MARAGGGCGLGALADACAGYVDRHRLPLTLTALRALPDARAGALLLAAAAREARLVQEVGRLAPFEAEADRLRPRLAAAAEPCGDVCVGCGYNWFKKPNGKIAKYCLNCGK